MSLLPIIYTSLLITGAFLVIVIIISYISYKVKNKGQKIRHVSYDPNSDFNYAVQKISSQVHKHPVKKETPKIVIVKREKKPSLDSKPNHKTNSRLTRTLNLKEGHSININPGYKSNIIEKTKVRSLQNDTKPDFMKKSSAGKHNKRLEVINSSDQRNNQIKVSQERRNLIALSEKLTNNDLLNYYTDNEDSNFYSLKSAGIA